MGGVRLHSKTKVVYKDSSGDKHKKKEKNNFNMVPFKADLVGRVGYKRLSLWGSYTLTNMFKSDKILEKVFVKGAEMGLDNEFLEKVFKAIHQASIDRQTKVMNE